MRSMREHLDLCGPTRVPFPSASIAPGTSSRPSSQADSLRALPVRRLRHLRRSSSAVGPRPGAWRLPTLCSSSPLPRRSPSFRLTLSLLLAQQFATSSADQSVYRGPWPMSTCESHDPSITRTAVPMTSRERPFGALWRPGCGRGSSGSWSSRYPALTTRWPQVSGRMLLIVYGVADNFLHTNLATNTTFMLPSETPNGLGLGFVDAFLFG